MSGYAVRKLKIEIQVGTSITDKDKLIKRVKRIFECEFPRIYGGTINIEEVETSKVKIKVTEDEPNQSNP